MPELKSKLQPHQERAIRKLMNTDGLVLMHALGSGKTLTAIAAGQRLERPMEVVVPAPLAGNFEKEVAKHVAGELPRRVRSYQKLIQDAKKKDGIDPSRFLVVDEAHRLRNTGTDTHKYITVPARSSAKRLLLTGTPIYNRASDLAPLVNIAAGTTVLPEGYEFDRTFIGEEPVPAGLLKSLFLPTAYRQTVRNRTRLLRALQGRIDIHEGDNTEFPTTQVEDIRVPMTGRQLQVYRFHTNQIPAHLRKKIQNDLPPSKAESKDLNAYMAAVRQASLSPRPYVAGMRDEEEDEATSKIQVAAARLASRAQASDAFRGVVYSNYIDAGLNPYARALRKSGVKFNMFTGAATPKERARIVSEYNEGKTPVLLVSSSGTEGLDLKGTRLIQVLEPHFNQSKIDQVIGRGVRFRSHAHLPEKERKVQIERYYSTLPEPTPLGKLIGKRRETSAEEYLRTLSDEKQRLAEEFKKIILEANK